MRTAILVIVAGFTLGCYNYDPLVPARPATGRYIALTLTDAGSQQLAGYLGRGAYVVRGRYLGDSEHGLLTYPNLRANAGRLALTGLG